MVELWSEAVNSKDIISKSFLNSWNYPAGMSVTLTKDATNQVNLGLNNRYMFMPFRPEFNFRSDLLSLSVVTNSINDITIFLFNSNPVTGLPSGQIFHVTGNILSGDLNFLTVFMKSGSGSFTSQPLSNFLFKASSPYWLGFYCSASGGTVRAINSPSCFPLSANSSSSNFFTCFTHTGALDTSIDSTVGLPNFSLISSSLPAIRFRTIQV